MTTNHKLREYAERLQRLDGERLALVEDIKAVRAEAAADGYNIKALNKALKVAAMTPEKRKEHEHEQLEMALYTSIVVDGVDEGGGQE